MEEVRNKQDSSLSWPPVQTEQLMEKGFGSSGDEEPDGRSSWAPWSYLETGEIYRRTNITATLAKLNPLLSEDKRKPSKDPQTLRNKMLWSDEPQF